MHPLPKSVGFKQLVKMVADTNPKELQEHKKKQKEIGYEKMYRVDRNNFFENEKKATILYT